MRLKKLFFYILEIFIVFFLVSCIDIPGTAGNDSVIGGEEDVLSVSYKSHETLLGGQSVFTRADIENDYLFSVSLSDEYSDQVNNGAFTYSLSAEIQGVQDNSSTSVYSLSNKQISANTTYFGLNDSSSTDTFSVAEWEESGGDNILENTKQISIEITLFVSENEILKETIVKPVMPITKVYTWQDLNSIRLDLTGAYVQQSDILFPELGTFGLSEQGFSPLGTGGSEFRGQYDGGGYEIDGFKIKTDAQTMYHGLFGAARFYNVNPKEGFKNIRMKNAVIDLDETRNGVEKIGVLVGEIFGDGNNTYPDIENVSIGGVTVIDGFEYIGILGGRMVGGFAEKVFVEGNVSSEGPYVGGIFGEIVNGKVLFAHSAVSLLAEDSDLNVDIGGIAGLVQNSSLESVFFNGRVVGHSNVGGIIGRMIDLSFIKNAFVDGDIEGGIKVGGIAGAAGQNSPGSMEKVYMRGNITRSRSQQNNLPEQTTLHQILGEAEGGTHFFASNTFYSSRSTVTDADGFAISGGNPVIGAQSINESEATSLSNWSGFTSDKWSYSSSDKYPSLRGLPSAP